MPRTVAIITGLLPILAIHSTYLVSASQGFVPWCFPYVESCTSISATGRHGAAFYLFKATMIPEAVLLMIYWYLSAQWLRQLGDTQAAARVIVIVGVTGALFLIVYVVALGAAGDMLRLQRRIGVIFYFTLTYLSQLLLIWRMGKVVAGEPMRIWLIRLSAATLLIGLLTIVLDLTIDHYDDLEDAFEWILALMVHVHFLLIARVWHRTRFRVHYRVG